MPTGACSTTPMEQFRDTIRRQREHVGKTQSEVARALGLASPEYIGLVERGERNLDLNRIPRLATALGLDPSELCQMYVLAIAPEAHDAMFSASMASSTGANGTRTRQVPTSVLRTARLLERLPSAVREHILALIAVLSDQQ